MAPRKARDVALAREGKERKEEEERRRRRKRGGGGRRESGETKMSGLYREEPLGEGQSSV